MALTSRAAAQRPRPSRRRPQPTTAMEAAIMRELAMIIASMVGTWAAINAGGREYERNQASINQGLQAANRRMTTRTGGVPYCSWAGARAPLPGACCPSPSPVCAMGPARAVRET